MSTLPVLLASMLVLPHPVHGEDLSLDPYDAAAPIPALWARADGPVAQGLVVRPWLWGPAIRSLAHEPYQESPGGARAVVYFDKARLEITHPDGDPSQLWYVSPGALVREMITGEIQIGDHAVLETGPATLPVTGDIEGNPLSPTYAALGRVASIGAVAESRRAPAALGQPVTARLYADGTVGTEAPPADVHITAYDEQGGHNLPSVFVNLIKAQPYPFEYVTGLALTEPYWVETIVSGAPERVLVQAFERRILTYTPSNPPGHQAEFGNVGDHYRRWRGLEAPDDPIYHLLASGVPWGEIIVDRALAHEVDPYVMAALAQIASGFTPLGQMETGGQGFFGLRPEFVGPGDSAPPNDPTAAADTVATVLAGLRSVSEDWRGALALYYTGGADPDWSDPGLNAFVTNVLDTQAVLIADYTPPPPQLLAAPPSLLGAGAAAYYSPSYTVAWWERTMRLYASWGNIAPGWSYDPNGYYCVKPGFQVGQRLQLTANGVTLWCTIGDTVAQHDLGTWLSRWAVELSWDTFVALGLNQNNWVEVRAP